MSIKDIRNTILNLKIQNCNNIKEFDKKIKEIKYFLKKKNIRSINVDIIIEYREADN